MPPGLDVSLETDFGNLCSKRERPKKEIQQKEYNQRLKENILRMFETKN